MKTRCCICDAEIELPIDEIIRIEDEIDDYVCDDCAEACIKKAPVWWQELMSHLN